MKEYTPRKSNFVEIKLCDNKMEVFKIQKGKNLVLKRKSFWVDKTKIFPVQKKSSQETKMLWVPKTLKFLQVMRDEKYDSEWYIDNEYSRHRNGRREELREFRSLKDGGKVKLETKPLEKSKATE